MEAYKSVFEFVFDSQQGAEVQIVIEKFGYTGETRRRALGSAPILKRQNNKRVYGTSLEIFAECMIDGEYAELYTSSAFEYRVRVLKNDTLLWVGYVTPELYSEPDIAPPYDVQIIATDSLGELKGYTYETEGLQPLLSHFDNILGKSGLRLGYDIVSDLHYVVEDVESNSSSDLMNIRIDLSHENGNTYYDVLQSLLDSLNAGITQHNGKWLLFRETDFIRLASETGLISYTSSAEQRLLNVSHFGSVDSTPWWPVNQLFSEIIPAQKDLVVEAPDHYKPNALSSAWTLADGAYYDDVESGYLLPAQNAKITQKLNFAEEVGYRLGLTISARNISTSIGLSQPDQNLALIIKIHAHTRYGYMDYWLMQNDPLNPNSYGWRTDEQVISLQLSTPSVWDTAADAEDLSLVIPIYDSRREGLAGSWIYADSLDLTIMNLDGNYPMAVYDVVLNKYEQIQGYQAEVVIDNQAREKGETVVTSFVQAISLLPAADAFMTGVPTLFEGDIIKFWKQGSDEAKDYLSTMAKDYARNVALPLMKYSGIINFPADINAIPALFYRNGTYYFPKTYSYNLYADEISVELISISAADVTISSISVSQSSAGAGTTGTTTGGVSGGGGPASSLWDEFASFKRDFDAHINLEDGAVRIKDNLIVQGDAASGGEGEHTRPEGTVTGVKVGEDVYENVQSGILDMTEAFEGLQPEISLDEEMSDTSENAVQNKVIKAYVDLHPRYKKVADIEVPDYVPGGGGADIVQLQKILNEIHDWYSKLASLVVEEDGNVRIKSNVIIDGDVASK